MNRPTEHQLKSKLTWPKCRKSTDEIETKMEQEQWLQLKMLYLLGYNLKTVIWWGELTFGRGGGGGECIFKFLWG